MCAKWMNEGLREEGPGLGLYYRLGISGDSSGHRTPSLAPPRQAHQWTEGRPGSQAGQSWLLWAGAWGHPSRGWCGGNLGLQAGERSYIHQNLKQKPHGRLSAGSGFYGNRR